MTADLIVTNARILTMDDASPRASALAVGDGRILAIGSGAEISKLAGPATRHFDGMGRTLLPGFIEAHMHVFGGGAILGDFQLPSVKGEAEMRDRIRAHAAAHPDAKVIYCQGAEYAARDDGSVVDRHFLDSILADRPLAFVSFDHHTMWANTVLLDRCGLLGGKALGPGNEIVMAADGLAHGELREVEAFGPIDVPRVTWACHRG